MNVLALSRVYVAHPDPAAAAANLIAFVVALNGPFYPLYVIGVIGWAGVPAFATMLASPLFFVVPWLSRRSSVAGRVAVPLIGTINSVGCAKLFGVASDVQLFCLPCIMLAALLYRDRERWLGLTLVGLALLPLFLPADILGPPLLSMDPGEAARIAALNAGCVGPLMGLIALQFRDVFSKIQNNRAGEPLR